MDATGLFYAMAPDKTISDLQIEGFKQVIPRITISLTCNSDGSDKLPLFLSAMTTSPDTLARRLVGSLDMIIAAA